MKILLDFLVVVIFEAITCTIGYYATRCEKGSYKNEYAEKYYNVCSMFAYVVAVNIMFIILLVEWGMRR